MLLLEFLNQPDIPDELGGKVTAPAPSIRVLHAKDCEAENPVTVFPQNHHLVGCRKCGNTKEVELLLETTRSLRHDIETVRHELNDAFVTNNSEVSNEEDTRSELATMRVYHDPAWSPQRRRDSTAETFVEEFLQRTTGLLHKRHLASMFNQDPFQKLTPGKSLVFVELADVLNMRGVDEITCNQVPQRVVSIPEEYGNSTTYGILSIPRASRTKLHHYYDTAKIQKVETPSAVLLSETYDPIWQLAQEHLVNLYEVKREEVRNLGYYDKRQAMANFSPNLDSILRSVELAYGWEN